MNEGLVTRIGKWLDLRWEGKVGYSQLQEQEAKCSERHIGALAAVSEAREYATAEDKPIGKALADTIKQMALLHDAMGKLETTFLANPLNKEVADLKTRLEKLEMHSGMYRKIDPTKPPVVKSAFSM